MSGFRLLYFLLFGIVLITFSVYGNDLYHRYFGSRDIYKHMPNSLSVHYVNVGHGNCTILHLPDGKIAIIDGGHESAWLHVRDYINTRIRPADKYIDYLINSHPHSDHLDGLLLIDNDYNVGEFFDYKNIHESMTISGAEYKIQFHAVTNNIVGDVIDTNDENEYSQIITVEYYDFVFVFTGDAGTATETVFYDNEIAKENSIFDNPDITTFLQVGHHGSRTSTGTQFLSLIKPAYAIISLREPNTYRHPHKEVETELTKIGAEIIKTSAVGDVVITCVENTAAMLLGYKKLVNLNDIWITMICGYCLLFFINFRRD